jgi:16S rRNA C1402 (ribose-2'-O) methylase RsmI
MKSLIEDIVVSFGKDIPLVLAYQLTLKNEKFIRGSGEFVLSKIIKGELKGEFVLLINNRSKNYRYK